ncbi:DNA polymerase [Vibrio phage pVco-7]|uniref:Uncharacterized protein n=1 Tax=Vibrio phage pVco-5 TaxID=1965485 RepID=A0A1W6JUN9_9CAUD|nr:hypothetical protein KNT61_gp001 [Vibrio phage pVco-5]ARM70989.1 hypothetical protein pVco5_001 [Vibrio phage pVco-5]
MLSVVELKESIPKQHRSKIDQQFVDKVNAMVADPEMAEVYTNNIITYSKVLQEGRFKLDDYFNAVMFVSYKAMGMSSMGAYQKVFPAKCQAMAARNVSTKDMSAYASTYNKNKLVTLIYEQTLIPDHIMYASVRHKAIAAQANLLNSQNEYVVQKAADSLMNHLKAPESAKLTVDLTANDSGVIADLAAAVSNLSNKQREKVIEGQLDTKSIAHSNIIPSNIEDAEHD